MSEEYSFEPEGSYVVVRMEPVSDMAGKRIHHCDYSKDIPQVGRVLAVGPGHYEVDGTFSPTEVKPGMRVLFNKWAECDLKLPGEVFAIFHERDLLAELEEDVAVNNSWGQSAPADAVIAAPAVYEN